MDRLERLSGLSSSPWTWIALLPVLLYLYVVTNDRKLLRIPPDALKASPHRVNDEELLGMAQRIREKGDDIHPILGHLPPATGRRYIVIGGAGFTGGWIVLHLLHRGEDPSHIRVVDLRPPSRPDLISGRAALVEFAACDISDPESIHAAFTQPWSNDASGKPLTVFHTAANIRFFERHPALLDRSARVNVIGARNVVAAAQRAGADVLVATSSASVGVRRARFLLWPWEKEPKHFVQHFQDNDETLPALHEHYFSNYAVSKAAGEKIIRGADGAVTNGITLRTGVLRPANGVYGPGGDILCGGWLVRGTTPTWTYPIVQNFCAVELVSLGHLAYEAALLALPPRSLTGTPHPRDALGGGAITLRDPGPPVAYGDAYNALNVLSAGRTTFPRLSPTVVVTLAHVFEVIYLARELGMMSTWAPVRLLAACVPRLSSDSVNLQPSTCALVMVHLIFDGSQALLPVEQGGLGLAGAGLPTLESLCWLVAAHERAQGPEKVRGIGLGWLVSGVRKRKSPSPGSSARESTQARVDSNEMTITNCM